MNKNKVRVILNKLRERISEEFPDKSLTKDQKDLFFEIDEFIMNFEDEVK